MFVLAGVEVWAWVVVFLLFEVYVVVLFVCVSEKWNVLVQWAAADIRENASVHLLDWDVIQRCLTIFFIALKFLTLSFYLGHPFFNRFNLLRSQLYCRYYRGSSCTYIFIFSLKKLIDFILSFTYILEARKFKFRSTNSFDDYFFLFPCFDWINFRIRDQNTYFLVPFTFKFYFISINEHSGSTVKFTFNITREFCFIIIWGNDIFKFFNFLIDKLLFIFGFDLNKIVELPPISPKPYLFFTRSFISNFNLSIFIGNGHITHSIFLLSCFLSDLQTHFTHFSKSL